jgi:hypothetical protein
MNLKLILPLVTASALLAGAVVAADHEAGVPLTPAEAAGSWTVETGGHAICMIQLSPDKAGNAGFGAQPGANCGGALPDGVVGWAPTSGGMALTGDDGKVLVPFNRWSNSLFVSHRSSGTDVQLTRGAPPAPSN